ncbi:MAG: hypothetical protein SGI84_11375 [Gemmatimonadota bacterium]|nr:hypothetical protein [Gemmatimonadota bacterium]
MRRFLVYLAVALIVIVPFGEWRQIRDGRVAGRIVKRCLGFMSIAGALEVVLALT